MDQTPTDMASVTISRQGSTNSYRQPFPRKISHAVPEGGLGSRCGLRGSRWLHFCNERDIWPSGAPLPIGSQCFSKFAVIYDQSLNAGAMAPFKWHVAMYPPRPQARFHEGITHRQCFRTSSVLSTNLFTFLASYLCGMHTGERNGRAQA
jgi:hypothetical protein